MKKVMMTGAIFLLGAGGAVAQTWPTENGQYRLQSCYGTKDGVQCDLTYTLLKKQTLDVSFTYGNYTAFTLDGTKTQPKVSVGGGDWQSYPSAKVYNGTPIKVSLLFNVPANITTFSALAIGDENVKNVPVRPLGAPAPAAVAAPSPTPTSTGTPITFSNGNYFIALSDCKKTSNPGMTICVAVLQKR